jgi:hypothetical protein
MLLEEVATINFRDQATGDGASLLIRAGRGQLAMSLSLAEDGDVEAILGPLECEALLAAIRSAVPTVLGQSPRG